MVATGTESVQTAVHTSTVTNGSDTKVNTVHRIIINKNTINNKSKYNKYK
jgi:hypothetical protein